MEAHWSERYHGPLRRISKKLLMNYPLAPLSLILDYAILAVLHTMRPEGSTLAILAFETQPRIPIGNYDQQPQTVANRMDLMQISRREYETIVARLLIRRALYSAPPNRTSFEFTPRSAVLVYREKDG